MMKSSDRLASKYLFYHLLPLPNLQHPSFWALKVKAPKTFVLNTIEFIHRFPCISWSSLQISFYYDVFFFSLLFLWRFWEYFCIPQSFTMFMYIFQVLIRGLFTKYFYRHLSMNLILEVRLQMCAKDVIVNNHGVEVQSDHALLHFLCCT